MCSGSFSWKEDLVHHFGAVHHLEDLADHLESEFTCETCPSVCRVPRTLLKHLLPEPASGLPTYPRASDTALSKNQLTTSEYSDTDGLVHRARRSNSTEGNVNGEMSSSPSKRSVRRESSDFSAKAIERYHCELCEFSANDIQQLLDHGSEHRSQSTPTSDRLYDSVSDEPSQERSSVSPRKPEQDRLLCDYCPLATKCQRTLAQHTKLHERSASVTTGYKCAYCNLACSNKGSIKVHQLACHRDQPVSMLRISDGKVVDNPDHAGSVSKTVKAKLPSSPSGFAVKKKRKLKRRKSRFTAGKSNLSVAEKTLASRPSETSSLNTEEALSNGTEEIDETLESKLPEQMIYRKPVCCPWCNFRSRARVNLVRHIRLVHGSQSEAPASPYKSCSSGFTSVNQV